MLSSFRFGGFPMMMSTSARRVVTGLISAAVLAAVATRSEPALLAQQGKAPVVSQKTLSSQPFVRDPKIAIASDAIMAKLEENRTRLEKLGDPRSINMDDAQAEALVNASTPIYYITGTIHSPETGAPTALMELAYRLVVDDHEYIKSIRNNVITLITPVVEVDGRNKMVDIYKWHLANPGKTWPGLVYWGKS